MFILLCCQHTEAPRLFIPPFSMEIKKQELPLCFLMRKWTTGQYLRSKNFQFSIFNFQNQPFQSCVINLRSWEQSCSSKQFCNGLRVRYKPFPKMIQGQHIPKSLQKKMERSIGIGQQKKLSARCVRLLPGQERSRCLRVIT